ncbi:ABC transporter permease subunit [Herbiconiux sp.]|uniref:ABC transporter permease n=1 Tax=Herbiconiux sp. TaxID=1871186 RepID=UPI0025BEB764|nr:ABC transporter permease subunit [Herbiconiux sp.]
MERQRPPSRAVFTRWLLVLPLIVIIGLAVLWPMGSILLRSFTPEGTASFSDGFTFEHYASIFADDVLRNVTWGTLKLGVYSTVGTVIFTFPVAYLLSRLKARTAGVLLLVLLLPFWVSILVRLFSYTTILGRNGIINGIIKFFGGDGVELLFNTPAVVIGMIAYLSPYMLLILYAGMTGIDQSLVTVAKTMGASGMQIFRRIIMPLIMPSLISGSLLVFVLALGFFLTPAILGGPKNMTIPVYIEQQIGIYQWGSASATGIVLAVVSLIGYAIAMRIAGTSIFIPSAGAGSKGSTQAEPLPKNATTAVSWIFTVALMAFMILPLLVVVPTAFGDTSQVQFPPKGFTLDWFSEVLTSPTWTDAISKSFVVGLSVAILSPLMALGVARVIQQTRRPWVKSLLMVVSFAPLVIPVILLAIGNFDVQNGLRMTGSTIGLIPLHVIISYPLALLVITNALNRQDRALEEAAWSMGISRIRTFWTIVVPSIVPALMAAAVLSFVTSWDEAVLSYFQTGSYPTLPVQIFSLIKSGVTPAVPAISVLLMLPVVIVTLVLIIRQLPRKSKKLQNPAEAAQ